jgi:hypothetical protein
MRVTTSESLGPTKRALAHWLGGPSAALAWMVPLLVTLDRLAPTSQWRDDVAIVRGLGFLPIGGEGVVSSVLAQCAALLPIGGRLLRAAMPSALATAAAAALIFGFAQRLLDKNAVSPRLGPLLALVATWSVVLGPAWQAESTIAGGASVGAALVLGAAALRFRFRFDARGWLGFGVLLGAALIERRSAGLACLGLLIVDSALLRQLPTKRELLLLLGGACLVVSLGLLPFLAQPARGGIWLDFDGELARLADANALPVESTLSAWVSLAGPVTLGGAALGGLWALWRRVTRPWLAPLLTFPLLDLGLPAAPPGTLAADPGAPLRLLALATLSIAAAVAAHTLALALDRARVPLARPVQALVVVFCLVLVLVAAEESGQLTKRQSSGAAEFWTDEALGSLPRASLLMVRSEPAAFRLWASRVARGERPDLTVVALPLLNRGDSAARLLELEPNLAPLIRELRMSGIPSEYALSSLADARPLYLEFDPRWDQRLLEHVRPHPFWLEFAPHALGRSDRTAALEQGRDAFSRVMQAASKPLPDSATLSVLGSGAREQAVLLAALGDKENAASLVEQLEQVPDQDAFVSTMQAHLSAQRRGTDWMRLLE